MTTSLRGGLVKFSWLVVFENFPYPCPSTQKSCPCRCMGWAWANTEEMTKYTH